MCLLSFILCLYVYSPGNNCTGKINQEEEQEWFSFLFFFSIICLSLSCLFCALLIAILGNRRIVRYIEKWRQTDRFAPIVPSLRHTQNGISRDGVNRKRLKQDGPSITSSHTHTEKGQERRSRVVDTHRTKGFLHSLREFNIHSLNGPIVLCRLLSPARPLARLSIYNSLVHNAILVERCHLYINLYVPLLNRVAVNLMETL